MTANNLFIVSFGLYFLAAALIGGSTLVLLSVLEWRRDRARRAAWNRIHRSKP